MHCTVSRLQAFDRCDLTPLDLGCQGKTAQNALAIDMYRAPATRAPELLRLTAELVAKVELTVAIPPPGNGRQTPDSYYEETAENIMASLPPSGELWIFAFGSLLWKPGAEFGERRSGRIHGWHRAFCLGWDRGVRGNPENPGLMLSLDRGGQCAGAALRVHAEGAKDNLLAVLRREPPIPPRWVKVVTAEGPVQAIAFVNDRNSHFYISGLSHAEIADVLSKAHGRNGSMAEYLHNTVVHLETLGIHDRHLRYMEHLVAERLGANDGSGRQGARQWPSLTRF
ncbi:gamma-glutamylcyclotransferase [Mesorhizobium sp.]|uniref:gamma-glutamylcyclotransferase n=1 Tax=Mesorhizobium sp. TaxID=1871066 RepID=UPI0026D43EE7